MSRSSRPSAMCAHAIVRTVASKWVLPVSPLSDLPGALRSLWALPLMDGPCLLTNASSLNFKLNNICGGLFPLWFKNRKNSHLRVIRTSPACCHCSGLLGRLLTGGRGGGSPRGLGFLVWNRPFTWDREDAEPRPSQARRPGCRVCAPGCPMLPQHVSACCETGMKSSRKKTATPLCLPFFSRKAPLHIPYKFSRLLCPLGRDWFVVFDLLK